ncbi:hypothetical protein NUACC21_11360 [Scytonema sp. NUACC21]
MFTHVKSTIRHIAPDRLQGRHLIKVVYVVLESQYQSALSQAVRAINENNPNLAIEISGYLIEELRDQENYEEFKKDIATANIFIASLIFIEDLAQKLVTAVEPHRDRLDVAVVFPSMPEVMRLNKMGTFSLAQLGQSKSAIAQFMRKRKEKSGAGFQDGMLKLLRTLPQVLKYLPMDKAQDARNFMLSFQHCSFCAFRRDETEDGAYWLDWAHILEKATDAVQRGATEICMQGGLNSKAKVNGKSLPYYLKLVATIKQQFPKIHLHAFSPQEVQFIARVDELEYADVILALQEAGVDSMPGTAAEVLDDEVRRILCPEKIDTATWLEIVTTAHKLGLHTTSTMLSGHIETPEQQIGHLEKLRNLQQTAIQREYPGCITEFILLPFVGQEAPKPLRRRVGRDQPVLADSLLLSAVARIFLGNWIPNHQPSWVKLGLSGATEALKWGCNDIGGTLMEEHITTMAGAQGGTNMEVETLQAAIANLGRPYHQRDTLYKLVVNG